MENPIINKKTVKSNKSIKLAQKRARKYYKGRVLLRNNGGARKKIRKFVDIENVEFISLIDDKNEEKKTKVQVDTKEQLISICREHQLTGRSGNGFPTADKLNNFKTNDGILLINGVECDPGLVSDAWLYRNRIDKVNEGVKILDKIFKFNRKILATKEPLKANEYSFEQARVKDRFPMGYEKMLIKSVFNIELSREEIPSDKGILVLNLQTVVAIAEICSGESQIENKYLTVANMNDGKALVVKAPIGANAVEVFKKVSTKFNENSGELYIGSGALNCHKVESNESVVTTTNFIARGNMPDYEKASKCVSCGGCQSICPGGVQVGKIVQYVEKNGKVNPEQCAQFHPELCIGCGACTYICHAGKNTRSYVAWAKMANQKK